MDKLSFNIFPNVNFIDLCMYQFGHEQCEPGHSFGPATRNHYLFHYVLSGTGTLMADNAKGITQTYNIKSGQGFMIFPGQINTYIADDKLPWEYIWIEFDGLRVKEALTTTDLTQNNPVYHTHSKDIREKLVEENYAYFSIDDLGFLQKGGRIGKASAFLGTTLKIKPLLSFEKENGEIYVPSKVRGNKKVKSKLVELIEKHLEDHPHQKFALAIADGNNLEERNELEKILKEKFPTFEYIIDGHVGAALSCYLGSGLLGVAIQFI